MQVDQHLIGLMRTSPLLKTIKLGISRRSSLNPVRYQPSSARVMSTATAGEATPTRPAPEDIKALPKLTSTEFKQYNRMAEAMEYYVSQKAFC